VISPWRGKKVLITSGPTREYLDPIRFLSNASSGRMGFALAREAARLGARVSIVCGPVSEAAPAGVRVIKVISGLEMYRRTLALCGGCDVVIGAAAVSDWRFASTARHKIKRSPRSVRLTLVPNPDIIKEVARRRRPGSGQIVVGFALETRDWLRAAAGKLAAKGLDLVVANGAASLSGDRSRAAIVGSSGKAKVLPPLSKRELAKKILKAIETEWKEKNWPN
jgi:phosphopantothenoylcysteine decarboxylase/phosphopantothenate--cysteine ligase